MNAAGKADPDLRSRRRNRRRRATRTQFPNNVIPANRLDPVAREVMKFYPLPNRPADNITGANNFIANFVQATGRTYYMREGGP